jgi:hypothetical protein
MQDTLRQLIPPGTPAAEALATLKKDGFDCSLNTNVPIPDWSFDGPFPEETGDFISAERVTATALVPLFPLSPEWRWRIVLILKDGVVERYRTYISFSGG